MADRGISNSNSSNTSSSNYGSSNSYGTSGNRNSNSSTSTSSAPPPGATVRKRREYERDEPFMDASNGPQGFDSSAAQFSTPQVVPQTRTSPPSPAPASIPASMSLLQEMEQAIWDALRQEWDDNNEKSRASDTDQSTTPYRHQGLGPAEAFAAQVARMAQESDCVRLDLRAGQEKGLIKGLLSGGVWNRVSLTILEDVDPGFLLELEDGLRKAGLQKTITLVADARLWQLPSLPSVSKRSRARQSVAPPARSAIQFEGLNLTESTRTSNSLDHLLRQANPKLTQFEWKGWADTTPLVLALHEGSHALEHLGLSPLPSNALALISMLKRKTGLDSLRLEGNFSASQLSLAQVLEAAPGITALTLAYGQISPANLAACGAAFAKSKLQVLNLFGIKFGSQFSGQDPSFLELAQGVATATGLKILRFLEFGASNADRILLTEFAKNAAAKAVSNASDCYADSLPALLIELNQERRKNGWNDLHLELLDPTACGENQTPDDSPRTEAPGIEPPVNSDDSD